MQKTYLVMLVLLLNISAVFGQQWALKTNLLYDATLSPNLGVEVATGKRHSLQAFYGINAWNYGSNEKGDKKAQHWMVMPEFRWWTCSVMSGWFIGVHGMGGQFNAGNIEAVLPGTFFSGINLQKEAKDARFEGGFVGGGITAGYQHIISRHWSIEFELGAGYDYVWYDKFPCSECGTKLENGHTNYVGLTKAGIVLMYVF